jgi:N6-L-threonylcarbamoyladenine synthase
MHLLAVESSCDETAAAVLLDGRVLSNVVSTQVAIHAAFGGVVPELASRNHMQVVLPVINRALKDAAVGVEQLDAVCATYGPGLIGSLLVGLQAAKALAFARNLPFVGVHHLEGHLLAIQLVEEVPFPFVGLVCSGGHTALYRVDGVGTVTLLGETRDDAAGEAFDKTGKLAGLPYPAGAAMDALADGGNPARFPLPRALPGRTDVEFSFSGVKTAARTLLEKHGPLSEQDLKDYCASLRAAIVDVLVRKSMVACLQTGVKRLVLAGGVAANGLLRRQMVETGKRQGVTVHVPPRDLCTDNAAMIGRAGYARLLRGERHPYTLDADASAPLVRPV